MAPRYMTISELHLCTPRLELSALTAQDIDVIWPSVSDPAVSEHMSWSAHRNKDETLAFLKRIECDLANERGFTWAIRSMGEFCGIFSIIGILRAHRALRYDRGELAYWCVVKHQGKGLMTEAGRSVIEFAFTKLLLNRIVVAHHLENDSSRRLIERLGFKLIGIEHEAFMKNGRWIDTKMYELLKKEYSPAN
jgi:Acetyltransferases, including N-acetylases of ribosomal proteins